MICNAHLISNGFWIVEQFQLPRTSREDFRIPKQPQWRRRQKFHKFAYLKMKSSCLARSARAFFIFVHFTIVIDLPRQEMTRLSVGRLEYWTKKIYFFSFPPPNLSPQFHFMIVSADFEAERLEIIRNRKVSFSDYVFAVNLTQELRRLQPNKIGKIFYRDSTSTSN